MENILEQIISKEAKTTHSKSEKDCRKLKNYVENQEREDRKTI